MDRDSASADRLPEDPKSSNARLINEIVASLNQHEDCDKELTAILSKHLLTVSPTQDAVTKATDEIEQLAVERAKEFDE